MKITIPSFFFHIDFYSGIADLRLVTLLGLQSKMADFDILWGCTLWIFNNNMLNSSRRFSTYNAKYNIHAFLIPFTKLKHASTLKLQGLHIIAAITPHDICTLLCIMDHNVQCLFIWILFLTFTANPPLSLPHSVTLHQRLKWRIGPTRSLFLMLDPKTSSFNKKERSF